MRKVNVMLIPWVLGWWTTRANTAGRAIGTMGWGQADTRITHHPLYPELGADVTTRQAAYRALFRSQQDDEAIADIRLALLQGQPLGSDRFSDAMCVAVGIRRSRKRPGRPAAPPDQMSGTETQPDFGF